MAARLSAEQAARGIKKESDFFQWLKNYTANKIYWERVEPKTEGGFPDSYWVMASRMFSSIEGTAEFKFVAKPANPKKIMESSQKVNFIDYYAAGGKRRFLLVFVASTLEIWVYDTETTVECLLQDKNIPSVKFPASSLGLDGLYELWEMIDV